MAVEHKTGVQSQGLSQTNDLGGTQKLNDEKLGSLPRMNEGTAEADHEDLNYPQAWRFEKYFVGGYSQKRMVKFKKPKSMYTAINLFAGEWEKLLSVDL